jgi:Ca-activated chloride channel family protein
MLQFEWLWMLLALPLPFLIRRLLPPAASTEEAALQVPFADDFTVYADRTGKVFKNTPFFWLAAFFWVLLLIAAARPVWLGAPIEIQVSGRNLLLAIDLSGSMQTEDLLLNNQQVTRLEATKKVAGEFIERRTGDRIGLLLFGTQPYLQAPLTFDRKTVQTLLNEAVIGLAGKKTAIGDAIGLGVKRLQELPAENKVIILLTDGANTAGTVQPEKAAEFAKQAGITIYTIGVGADEMLVNSFFSKRLVNPSADLDEKTLSSIATITGGHYFRAKDTRELEKIYALIDDMEPVLTGNQFFRPKSELYVWPLGAALLLCPFLVIARGRK